MSTSHKPATFGADLRPDFCHAPVSGYMDRQCTRRGVLPWTGEDGIEHQFCRLHHPVEVARKQREQAAFVQREREQTERVARNRADRARRETIRSLSTEELLAECERRGIQTGMISGRISPVDPNYQNIPIRTTEGRRIREAFFSGSDPSDNP